MSREQQILIRQGAVILESMKSNDPEVSEILRCLRSYKATDISEVRDDVVVAAITRKGYELRSYNLNQHSFYVICEQRGIAPPSVSTTGCGDRIFIETTRTFPLDEVELSPENLASILKQTVDIIIGLDKLGLFYSDCQISGFRYIRREGYPPKIVITNMADMVMAKSSKLKNMLKTLFISVGFESSVDSPMHLGMLELEQMVKVLLEMPDHVRPYSCDSIKAIIKDW